MKHPQLKLTVNDQPVIVSVDSNRTLLDMLREDLDITSPKRGCEVGECGACIVLLDGKPVNSCMVLAVECEGKSVLTVEGLSEPGVLHPVQQKIVDEGAIQCGFCSPGMVLLGKAILDQFPNPTEEQIRTVMAGNLCRCTGYTPFVKAISAAAKERKTTGKAGGTRKTGKTTAAKSRAAGRKA